MTDGKGGRIRGVRKKGISTLFWLAGLGLLLVLSIKYVPSLQKIIYPYPHRGIIEKYSAEYGVDPLFAVAVIREESRFFPRSESHKGAVGLMQLMPDTAREVAESLGESDFSEESLTVPENNIRYGIKYLSMLEKQFSNNPILVLAAYNSGQGRVKEWLASEQLSLDHLKYEDIPFKETRNYVERVLKSYGKYQNLYSL